MMRKGWSLWAGVTPPKNFLNQLKKERKAELKAAVGGVKGPTDASLCVCVGDGRNCFATFSQHASAPFKVGAERRKRSQNLIPQTFAVEKRRRRRREEREIATNAHQWEAQEKKKQPITPAWRRRAPGNAAARPPAPSPITLRVIPLCQPRL